ncbi:MAG: response regulator transcription factor [Actinobacteria bacterium]|nr:response regulator transcription factor [Actinomycetota bacterium]
MVLLDQRLPDGSVVEAIIELCRLAPRSRVVLLVASSDDAVLVAATQAGAAGFVATTSPVEELVAAVRAAAAGDVLISPVLLPRLLARLQAPTVRGDGQQLTAREREVLELIAEGLSNAAIAARLVLSVNTVRNHVQNLLTKLGAHSKLEALSVAVRDGLLPLRRF